MISKNIKETEKIAKIFLNKLLKSKKKLKGALVVGLSGDLGSGKTAFTKSVAKHLDIKDRVFSPTYVIIKKYPIKLENYKFFFHIDAYRLEHEKELLHLGWEEIINNNEHLVFIEWPENISKAMPKNSKYIYISSKDSGHRNFKFK
ncbi:MAG: tRNA (adenosine(37)-N6)-threonylcarbamoyltransferase complex ATPase subunit type 1 TsaE [Candidatus Nomurabacteria bacterium]|nr:tRNA (adenosine(37)-N6)-threonylcarbamoyltransferase complex ATPase subunit type 1 TsaE [Candidatus Nomurabacteria bacterium]